MYGHGFIPEHDHTPPRGGRRRAGVDAWSTQHDAGRIAEPLAETDAAAGVAAIRRDCDHHARGLGDGALKMGAEGDTQWSFSIVSTREPAMTAPRRSAAANAAQNTICGSVLWDRR